MPGPSPGWLLDLDGNIKARWMATALLSRGTELGLQACLTPLYSSRQ